ncbi:MAG TPA: peroxiredoxin-like family protein, partial [Steroidobacteraceae bacterium]
AQPFVLMLTLLVALTGAESFAAVFDSPAAAKALQIGDSAPPFSVKRADGAPFVFSPDHLVKPQVLIFYRGGWCPYCNMQLADLHEVESRLRQSGFDVLFLSTDKPELLYTSLKDQNKNLPYTLLSDNELKAAEAFHIAFHVDAATYAKELQYGVNLEQTTGTTLHELPVPSVFIIDKSGKIRFVYSNPDYTVRLKAHDLWVAAQPLAK